MKNIPKNLYEHLDGIRERPGMYLGSSSITALSHYIAGYLEGCRSSSIDENLSPDFHDFNDFVATYYLRFEATAGWKAIILAENYGNEEFALKDFFRIFDLFRKKVKIENSKKILFSLIEKLTFQQQDFNSPPDELKKILKDLSYLPTSLSKATSQSSYDTILVEVEKYAQTNKYFDNLLQKLKT